MALINCPECGNKVSDVASVCIHCGYPLQDNNFKPDNETQYCPYCGKANSSGSLFCGYCGRSFSSDNIEETLPVEAKGEFLSIMDYKNDLDIISGEANSSKRQAQRQAKCPRCGSVSLSCDKRGFSVGQAVIGTILVGDIGVLAGGIGANDTIITCMNCGYKYRIG